MAATNVAAPANRPALTRRDVPAVRPRWWADVAGAVLALFLGLPLVGLLSRGLTAGDLVGALHRPIAYEALRLSLTTTALVLVLSLTLGSALALVLARRRFVGLSLLDTLVDLPMVLPPAVAGLALLLTFGRRGVFGDQLSTLGIELPFTTAAVVLAAAFVSAPFYVRSARAGFLAVPKEVEEAGRVDGCSDWQVFRFITAPVAAPALFGGAILCGARALGEFGATIMFAGSFQGRTQTMPLAIYSALESDLDAAISLSLVLLLVSFCLLLAFRRWLGGQVDTG